MKGVSIILDETKGKRYLQIDLAEVDRDNELMEDLFALIIAESEKDQPTISLAEMKRILQEDGKV
jgi:hypothetical protein